MSGQDKAYHSWGMVRIRGRYHARCHLCLMVVPRKEVAPTGTCLGNLVLTPKQLAERERVRNRKRMGLRIPRNRYDRTKGSQLSISLGMHTAPLLTAWDMASDESP